MRPTGAGPDSRRARVIFASERWADKGRPATPFGPAKGGR